MPYERAAFETALSSVLPTKLDVTFVTAKLDATTAPLASGASALCLFAWDSADADLLRRLRGYGVRLLVLRYAGDPAFDARIAADFGMRIARIPATAHTSIAEFAVTLMLVLARRLTLAANRVRDGNFAVQPGLVGVDMARRVVGVVGTGPVGARVATILRGFDCKVLAFDTLKAAGLEEKGVQYVSFTHLLKTADVVTLHAPLVPGTRKLINRNALALCKNGVHIVSTARAGLIDDEALVKALRSGKVGAVGMDIFEGKCRWGVQGECQEDIDPDLELLKSMPNVVITSHLSTLTENSRKLVADLTIQSLLQYQAGEKVACEIWAQRGRGKEKQREEAPF